MSTAACTVRPDAYGLGLVSSSHTIKNSESNYFIHAAAAISYPVPSNFDPDSPFHGLFNYATEDTLTHTQTVDGVKLTNRVLQDPAQLKEGIIRQANQTGLMFTAKLLGTTEGETHKVNIEALTNPLGHHGKHGPYNLQSSSDIAFEINHTVLDNFTKTQGIGDSSEHLDVRIGLRWKADTVNADQEIALHSILKNVLNEKNHAMITSGPKANYPMEMALDTLVNLFYQAAIGEPLLDGLTLKFRAEITRTKPVSGTDAKPEGGDMVILKAKKSLTFEPHEPERPGAQ